MLALMDFVAVSPGGLKTQPDYIAINISTSAARVMVTIIKSVITGKYR
jgi:hypothetical protein